MPTPTTHQRYAADALSPTVFRGTSGEKLLAGTIGVFFDAAAEGCNQAVKARFFGSDTFPPSALPYLGAGRSMPRYALDTDDTYIARLRDAWNIWPQAGTAIGIERQLAALGLTATVKDRTTTPTWNWDSDTENWSRFWVVITGHPWSPWTWGDGTLFGDGHTWGSDATVDEVRSVRALVRKWKPAQVVCDHIIVVMDEPTWDAQQPDGSWNNPAMRNPAAIYWKG
jgi:hypothetical protein